MLELPLSRDLNMDHKLELHYSSLGCTQIHAGLHPTKPVAHTGFQSKEATQGALLPIGTTNPNQHYHEVSLLIRIILEPTLNYTLQVPHCMICEHVSNPLGTGLGCS